MDERSADNKWSVYLIEATDQSLYCGISTDVNRRFKQHLTGKGAKYFRGRQPVEIVFVKHGLSHTQAAQLEIKIKKLTKKAKLALIANPQMAL